MPAENTLHSQILNEPRAYKVYLPLGYQDPLYAPVNYPLIYLLDGEGYGDLLAPILQHMAIPSTLPPTILVAVAAGTTRVRDYTPDVSTTDWQGRPTTLFQNAGGLDRFLDFLERELMPAIDQTYSTAKHRTLIGHSLGGLAAAHCLLSRPHLFQAYLSSDASLWWQQQAIVEQVDKSALAGKKPQGRYYSALADHETTGPHSMSVHVKGNQGFIQRLKQLCAPDLHVEQQRFADETHGSVLLPALYSGLRYLFYQHRLPHGWAPDLATVLDHYQRFSRCIGIDYPPPERLVNRLAWESAAPVLPDQVAETLLLYSTQQYPTSSHAHSSLGQWYLTRGECLKAQLYFQQALAINSTNREAAEGLDTLTTGNANQPAGPK